MSNKLISSVREEDTISRLGGDEFTIIIEGTNENEIIRLTEKIISLMQNKTRINDNEMFVTFSIGISRYPQDGDSPEELLRNADTAMYQAKDNGKNQYQFYNKEMTKKAIQRSQMELDLRKALEEG